MIARDRPGCLWMYAGQAVMSGWIGDAMNTVGDEAVAATLQQIVANGLVGGYARQAAVLALRPGRMYSEEPSCSVLTKELLDLSTLPF